MSGIAAAMVAAVLAGGAQGGEMGYLYEKMSAEQVAAAVERLPVAYLPAGINEWHGEQSACGLDALKAEALARMAARHLGGVCFPTMWLGPDGSTPFDPEKYPRGTLTIDRDLYHQGARELLESVEGMGFRVAVWLSGHYPGVVNEVAEAFNERGGMKVISISENQVVEGMPAGDHAGVWETSLLKVLRPGLVDLAQLPPLPAGVVHAGQAMPPDWPFLQRCEYYGIYGEDPRIWANTHFGKRGVKAVLAGMAARVGEALGDSAYGHDRGKIIWPGDVRRQPEVRYDYLLPHQWMERFEKAPIVYWPLAVADESIERLSDRAALLAMRTGGMAFPPLVYGPGRDARRTALAPETWAKMVREAVGELGGMDFRVVGLLTCEALSTDARRMLDDLRVTDGQYRIVVMDETVPAGELPPDLTSAIRAMIPDGASVRRIDGPWRINERRTIHALSENPYGPGDARVYEHEFELTGEEASQAALLDLGVVENHAEVMLNDAPSVKDHWPPYRVIVTGRLQAGKNRLKVIVHHQPQPTLDPWYYRVAPPRLRGPVTLSLWPGEKRE